MRDPLLPQSQSPTLTEDEILDAPDAAESETASEVPAIPERHKKAFTMLLETYDQDDLATRLATIRRVRKSREYWKGLQYLYWSERDGGVWKSIASNVGEITGSDQTPYQYVTNIYQSYGLTFISVLSQNAPTVRFWPSKPSRREDQATANAASDVAALISRNNKLQDIQVQAAYYLWTDGAVAGYVRYVTDGEEFGVTETPVMGSEDKQISPDALACASCGHQEEVDGPPDPMQPPMPCQGTNPDGSPCMQPVGPDNFLAGEVAKVPVQTGTREDPNGQEVMDVMGLLELRIPSYASRLKDAPYIVWSTEVAKAKVKSMYPQITDSMLSGASTSGAIDLQERQARVQLMSDSRTLTPNTFGENLVTFKRAWFRKWSFHSLQDKELVKELEKSYSKGAFVAFAGSEVAECRNESMDDCWVFRNAYPGEGSSKPAVGDSIVSVQERYNTLSNIEVETHEHGIPTLFVAEDAINMKAWEEEGNTPGLTWPVQTRPGLPVQAQIWQSNPAPVSPQITAHRSELMGPIAQFLTGLFPALFGGGAEGNDTASGYAMQRDQAMGRIGLTWRQYKSFNSEFLQKGVKCFAENRGKDGTVEFAVLGDAATVDSKLIHLDQLQGNFFASPETDEDFPMSWTQRKNFIQNIITNPLLAPLMNSPANMDALQKSFGPIGLEFPGADARTQQFREITELVATQPTMGPDPSDPQGLMGLPPIPTTSVPVDEVLDDHASHFAAGQEWAASAEGSRARKENPQGFLNVKLHIAQHQQIMQQQQLAQAQLAAGQGQGAPPAEKPSQQSPQEAAQAGQPQVQ